MNKMLKIIKNLTSDENDRGGSYPIVLALLAVAESNLMIAKKDSGLPHFNE